MTWRDVTERVRIHDDLAGRASRDSLTGLANRESLLSGAGLMFARRPRVGDRPGVLYCDVDRFKTVNDRFGHAVGDTVLQVLAERIRGCVRTHDIVARPGGDEFIVVLDGLRDEHDLRTLAAKIDGVVAAPIDTGSGRVQVSVSIGIAMGSAGDDPERVIALADADMYRAKRGNRAIVVADGTLDVRRSHPGVAAPSPPEV